MAGLTYLNLTTTDSDFNLAAEQYVFDELPKDRTYFMLWRNDRSIIIGKYQNTLAEINLPYVTEHGIRVVRRLSGGGAVYHDLGNLNFTFIADAGDITHLNMKLFCEPIVKVLRAAGLDADVNGRNDMTVSGMKFSGNSQYLRTGRVMHHGTILFDSDLSAVEKALRVDPDKIRSKGIKSVRSRVTNIRPLLPEDMTMEQFRAKMLEGVLAGGSWEEYSFTGDDTDRIEAIRRERYSTWEWNFGRSPECTMLKSGRVDGCGKIEAYITVNRGIISGMDFRGDFFSTEDPSLLAERFVGIRPERAEFSRILENVDVSRFFSNLQAGSLIDILSE